MDRVPGKFVLLALAAALCAAALILDGPWFIRHIQVPAFYLPASPRGPLALRASLAAAAVLCFLLAVRVRGSLGAVARIALASLLAVGTAELILRRGESGTTFWRARKLELRMGRPDAALGNVLVPSRTTVLAAPGAKPVSYAIDAWGDRAASDGGAPDPALPSLLVAGESIAIGHGLPFEQTFAAQLAARLGLSLVNVAVGGYGTDQAFWRLQETLPRLQRPAVVVMVFLPIQLRRNVQDYRPRLVLKDGRLVREEPVTGFFASLRLRDLAVNELPVLSEEKLRDSLAVTAAVLREAAAQARARGATPCFLVPVVGPRRRLDEHPEAQVLRPLFIEQGLPFVLVDLDESELIPYDGHPNAAASKRLAEALEARLREAMRC